MPNLAPKNNCTGCTACMAVCPNNCIKMMEDENGFPYPQPDPSACIECGQCEQVCPIFKETAYVNTPSAYAAISKDEHIRMESSSGGIFTELAKYFIEQGGVVYGAAYDEHFNVKHICVDNIDGMSALRGAKYAQSDLSDTFTEIADKLSKGQKVLFSGTPCQVGGLKSFIGNNDNLFCVDFVCHSVPSPMAWQAYIKYRARSDADGEQPVAINLRSKETGWSKYRYSNVFEYANGTKHTASSSQSLFMKLFVGDYICRESCENCKFKGYGRASDFTLGDFWGIWDIDREMDDDKGTSVILVHSEKGQAVWWDISDRIICKQVTLEQASLQNPSMVTPSHSKAEREDILAKIREGKIGECEELFVQPQTSLMTRIKGKVKRILKI